MARLKPPAGSVVDLAGVLALTLPNGLRLRLLREGGSPTVSYTTVFQVGSRNERPGITGISHLFEHMMFNGAARYGPKEFDRVLEARGGHSNAFTSNDLTVYFEDFAASALETVVDLESDRMRSLRIDDEALEQERAVVMEERRLRTDNSVFGLLEEQLEGLVFQAHPYRWPVIGWMSDIERIGRADCESFFRTYYAPTNAVVYAVGDLDPEATARLAERYYGDIPAGPPVAPVPAGEPEQRGERRAEVRFPAQAPTVLAGWRGPAAGSPDAVAMDLVQVCLGAGEASRLKKRLVHGAAVAISASVGWSWRIDPGVVLAYAELAPGVKPARVERLLFEEVARLAAEGPTAWELRRARALLRSGVLHDLSTHHGLAQAMGHAEALLGDWREAGRVLDRYAAVTAAEVRRVAARYLAPGLRSVVTLVPGGGAVSAIVAPPQTRLRLPNGLGVLVAQRAGVPLVAVRLLVRAGSSLDPAGRFGLASLTASALRRGTTARSGPKLDELVESLGAELGAGVDEDAASIGFSAPLEALPQLLGVLAEVVSRPAFPAGEVERLRQREMAGLLHDLDETGIVADRALIGAAYGDHPYGHPSEGQRRHLAAARRRDLVELHARHWRPSRATLVVVGPVDPAATLALVRRRFASWRGEPVGDVVVGPPAPPVPGVLIVDSPEATQVQLRIAAAGQPRSSPDYAAGVVAGAVVGGSFTSRLMEAIRVERGLSYGVRARFACGRAGGLFLVSSFTKVETAGELARVALDVLHRFAEGGPTEEELVRTRGYLAGLHPLSLETHEAWCDKLGEVELYGLPPDEVSGFMARVEAVDAQACQAVVGRALAGDRRVVVAVGPARRLAEQLRALGEVRVVPARSVM